MSKKNKLPPITITENPVTTVKKTEFQGFGDFITSNKSQSNKRIFLAVVLGVLFLILGLIGEFGWREGTPVFIIEHGDMLAGICGGFFFGTAYVFAEYL